MPRTRTSATRARTNGLPLEPADAAKAASLRYVTDARPGIKRVEATDGFAYVNSSGATVDDEATLARIKSLVIPPAWADVWICAEANGHLQATGRDARGRKQYRYHPRWHVVRDQTKYERLAAFGTALPRIRARLQDDLARQGLPREKVLATIVRLLETTLIRVGNEEYARANKSFGLTTLRTRHVEVDGSTIHFRFRGKSGKSHAITLNNRRLARLVQRVRELPGQDLFQYVDEAGEPQPIGSSDVNEYLREIAGEDFTAKDFRTWAGTLRAAQGLTGLTIPESNTAARAGTVAMVKAVADALGNTPAVSRKCYIHPAVLAAYEDQSILDGWTKARAGVREQDGELAGERALLRFLEAQSGATNGK